ncbi:MAG: enoyl-CoA hydratase [Rickettsiales bacterium]|nr:enoyl-CoA hydratase [Rickettsiales bacterium]
MKKKIKLSDSFFSVKDKVGLLTFNRDDIRNALTGSHLIEDIIKTITFVNREKSISVLVITGNGKAFSAGGNLKEMKRKNNTSFSGNVEEVEKKYRYGIQSIPKAFEKLEVPSIAALNGAAIGAGLDLACMCDLRIMSEDAFLSKNFINLGIIPGDGGAYYLQKIIGYEKASELSFTGRKVYAEEAKRIGLVLKTVEGPELMKETIILAKEIARKPPNTLRYLKRLLKMANKMPLDEFLDFSAIMQATRHNSKEHKKAIKALFKKRK